MCFKGLTLVFQIAFAFSDLVREPQYQSSIRLVQVVFRHGARTPESAEIYPNEIYNVTFFKPPGYGELTNKGKLMAYELGKSLRERYGHFLESTYTPELIKIVTTEYPRTQISALCVQAGLFPRNVDHCWDEQLEDQTIPYEYKRFEKDFRWTKPENYCPEYKTELKEVLSSEENIQYLSDRREIFKYFEKKTGKPITALEDAFKIYQVWSSEIAMGLDLPTWIRQQEFDFFLEMAIKQCGYENFNTKLKRLGGGRMLQKIVENLKQKSSNILRAPDRKMILYSGHDYNIYNLLGSLNLYDYSHFPYYASAVIIELHYSEALQNWTVKILYQQSPWKQPLILVLPGCVEYCPLDHFLKLTSAHVPINYTLECNSHQFLDLMFFF